MSRSPRGQVAVQAPRSLFGPSLMESFARDKTSCLRLERRFVLRVTYRTPSSWPESSSTGLMSGCSRRTAIASQGSVLTLRRDSLNRVAATGSYFALAARSRNPPMKD